jgi:acyl carrier protein
MNQQDAMKLIERALTKTLEEGKNSGGGSKEFSLSMDTDLIKEEILDSLDSMVFILELAERSGKNFPEDDLVERGFFKVGHLVEFLAGA